MISEWIGLTRGRPLLRASRHRLHAGRLRRAAVAAPSAGADGRETIIWIVACIWATDIGAYVVGRAAGGAKLAPRISPGKTWSGLFGGMAWAAVASAAVGYAFGLGHTIHAWPPLARAWRWSGRSATLSNRRPSAGAGVKDSGTLIPGHGGLLDRVDGLLAVLVVVALTTADRRRRMAMDMTRWHAPSPERPRGVTILGSTGSVGQSTVDLIARDPESYRVEALVAGNSVEALAEQARRLRARMAVVANRAALPGPQGCPGRHLDRGRGRAGGGRRGGGAAGRMGDGGRGGLCRPRTDPGGGPARRHGGAGQQGGAGLRRPAADRGDRGIGRGAAAGRFRAQRDLPGASSRASAMPSTG